MLRNGNGHEAIWTESTVGVDIALSSIISGFNEINVGSSTGTWWGQLRGTKSSTSTTGCGAVTTPAPDLTKINELFAAAQAKLAQYFPPSANAVNQTLDDYIYRFYPSTGIYLAINKGEIYVMGGSFGNTPLPQGNIETILSELGKINVDVPPAAEGDYKLVINGTITISSVVVLPPQAFSVTIDKIAAPSSSDIDGIRDAVKEALKDVNFTGTIDVSEVSSSSSGISFRVAFTGTSSGVNIAYNLLYTYTKL